jgi:hypothetical protein
MAKGMTSCKEPDQDDWRGESDYRTMSDANEIQSDKSRMAGVKKHHKKTMKKASLMQRTLMSKGR